MSSDSITDPPEVRKIMDKFIAEQKILGDRKRSILEQLKELKVCLVCFCTLLYSRVDTLL